MSIQGEERNMQPAITDIPGIGPAAAAALAEHRIRTVASLAKASVEKVSAVPGFSEARASKTIAAAAELLASPAGEATTGKSAEDKVEKPGKQASAKESGKKDKKKGKKDKKARKDKKKKRKNKK